MTDFYNLVPSAPKGRFDGIERPYTPADVKRLRGSVEIKYSLAEMGANRLWKLIHEDDFVNALGALSGNQAMQMVRAGLKAIYLSGWQVAADANTASAMYPDQSLYPANAGRSLPSASTARCSAPTRSRHRRARAFRSRPGSRRSSPTPKPVSAGRSTAFEIMKAYHRGGRRGRALRGPARLGKEVRPSRRQGADPDRRAYPQPQRRAARRRRDGRPRRSSSRAPMPRPRSC